MTKGSVPSTKSSAQFTTLSTALRRVPYFSRRGKRERRENLLRSLWRTPRTRRSHNSSAGDSQSQVSESSPRTSYLRNFALTTTPFVSLATRRRGKRATIKVRHLPRTQGQRKALRALSLSLHEAGASSASFTQRLSRQLESAARPVVRSDNATSSGSSRREIRDSIHQQAFRALPPSWLR
jgi:hypothetical protein